MAMVAVLETTPPALTSTGTQQPSGASSGQSRRSDRCRNGVDAARIRNRRGPPSDRNRHKRGDVTGGGCDIIGKRDRAKTGTPNRDDLARRRRSRERITG